MAVVAGNFHKTCMKVAPSYFKGCRVVIDRVHQPGHVRCSPAFCMAHFKEKLACINSQVAEQANSDLERSDQKGSLAHMGHFNFMVSFRFSMFLENLRHMRTACKLEKHTSFMELVTVLRDRAPVPVPE